VPSDITRTVSLFDGVLTVVTRQFLIDRREGAASSDTAG
jgi:hypothetical protein